MAFDGCLSAQIKEILPVLPALATVFSCLHFPMVMDTSSMAISPSKLRPRIPSNTICFGKRQRGRWMLGEFIRHCVYPHLTWMKNQFLPQDLTRSQTGKIKELNGTAFFLKHWSNSTDNNRQAVASFSIKYLEAAFLTHNHLWSHNNNTKQETHLKAFQTNSPF